MLLKLNTSASSSSKRNMTGVSANALRSAPSGHCTVNRSKQPNLPLETLDQNLLATDHEDGLLDLSWHGG